MPKYTLPKPKKKSKDTMHSTMNDDYMRRITVPVNDAILDEVTVGDRVTVTLMAEVERVANVEGDYKDKSISINLTSVEVYGGSKNNTDFERGYKTTKGQK